MSSMSLEEAGYDVRSLLDDRSVAGASRGRTAAKPARRTKVRAVKAVPAPPDDGDGGAS